MCEYRMPYVNDMLKNRRNYILVLIGVWVFFAIMFLRTSWLCDDAYITFRTVDNAVNGYGLRWNVNERVQAYTHPLWLFLHIPFYFITREMFLTPIFISFTISMLTIIILTLFVAQNTAQILIITSILGFSRAFVDFSSSGLENPMSHFLLVLFIFLFLRGKFILPNMFFLSFISCLATLNRQDCLLIYLPALIYTWWHTENKIKGFFILCAGFIPLLFWEIFSIVYYGFPFPNTAYAKLGAGIPRIELIVQGVQYYLWTWDRDNITSIVIFLGLIISLFQKKKIIKPLAWGMLLYCIYILWIGGDFMGGRYFTVPLLVATIIIQYSKLSKIQLAIPTAFIFILISLTRPDVPVFTGADYSKGGFFTKDGITTERKYYYEWSSLLNWRKGKPMPSFSWAEHGRENRKKNIKTTKLRGCVGFYGFFSGPLVHIVDFHGLGDPLLSHLPSLYHPKIAIGHFIRYVPEGYMESAGSNENKIEDTELAQFYDYIRIITRSPIWSWERFKVILKMNLGYYNHLIDKDKYQFADTRIKYYEEWEEEIQNLKGNQGIKIPERGLEIRLEEIKHNSYIELELRKWNQFHILLFNNKEYLTRMKLDPKTADMSLFTTCYLKVPKYAVKKGYDTIRIFVCPRELNQRNVCSEIRSFRLLSK